MRIHINGGKLETKGKDLKNGTQIIDVRKEVDGTDNSPRATQPKKLK